MAIMAILQVEKKPQENGSFRISVDGAASEFSVALSPARNESGEQWMLFKSGSESPIAWGRTRSALIKDNEHVIAPVEVADDAAKVEVADDAAKEEAVS